MKVVVLGDSGQLSLSLKKTVKPNWDVTYLSKDDAPFENFSIIESKLQKLKPTHVINAAAYTKVDLAEDERDLCFLINSDTPAKIANWCHKNGSLFYHYSTDYVFNGNNETPWKETDQTDPLNTYGKSKLKSEKEVLAFDSSYVFRTSWVYSEFGQNFVKTMIRFFKEKEEMNIVGDQIGAPNYATDLAFATWQILEQPTQPGLYHMSSTKFCSWYEFALKIKETCEELKIPTKIKKINSIKSVDYKTKAVRPLNSRLDSSKLTKTFNVQLPDWDKSLKICMAELLKDNS